MDGKRGWEKERGEIKGVWWGVVGNGDIVILGNMEGGNRF